MKLLVAFAIFAVASAGVLPQNEYLPPVSEAQVELALPVEISAPVDVEATAQLPVDESAVLADDGYRYKTIRRLKYRHRRDVNEIPSNQYLPAEEVSEVAVPVEEVVAPVEESAVLADDGYRYKTIRRLKYRHRRDVSEIPSNQYLPAEEVSEIAVPVEEVVAPVEESAVLADDGYRYKTIRRLKYRHRRDVNEIPSNQYLPAEEVSEVAVPVEEVVAPVEESAVLADDGYRYKTIRRLKYRHRRDVNEIPSNQYLPAEEVSEVAVPVEEVVAPVEESAVLADDGYRYKTIRRLKYRHRRDVNEIPSNQYLPAEEVSEVAVPVEEVVAPVEESAVLADDGYRYKTIRRLKYRHRRDVNEIPSNQYLPAEEVSEVAVPVEEVVAPVEESAVLADDGYRYKTIRRLKYRHRRDVNEIPSNQYLPAEEVSEVAVPVEEVVAPVEESAVLADDGYRYKTIRRLKYRHRRDVNEIPSNQYLPAEEVSEVAVPVEEVVAPVEESAVLADDGYRYKTIRRLKYRHRRDVNEIPSNQYLPAEEVSEIAAPVEEVVAPVEESAVLADDGYRYKTIRRLKYRHRRDVSEIPSNQYLPAEDVSEIAAPVEEVVAPVEESAVLADDGYRYKTIRRLKYRHRRDVSELPAYEYLPPVQALINESVVESVPAEESAVLADDGYRYKTLKKLKYRHRA